MHAPAGNVPSSRPVLMRLLVRSWEYRRPRLAVGVRLATHRPQPPQPTYPTRHGPPLMMFIVDSFGRYDDRNCPR